MATKTKSEVKILKGQEAEDKVLEYVKRMNRPYGAVDVAANLKGAVPKAATQKILVSLAEKGELVQKLYGKTTFFVSNQDKVAALSGEAISQLEADYKTVDEENKQLAVEVKSANAELARLKSSPTNAELEGELVNLAETIEAKKTLLRPLRSGAPLVSKEEIAQMDTDWTKWRAEWVRRKKVFTNLWQLVSDTLAPQDALSLSEDLGIEWDTPEHAAVEKSSLCTPINNLKRKR